MKYCINTQNQKTFAVEEVTETTVRLVVDGKVKDIKPSTFKRYYRFLDDQKLTVDKQKTEQVAEQLEQNKQQQQQAEQQRQIKQAKINNVKKNWQAYYKSYERNNAPLWDAVIENGKLVARDTNKNVVLTCKMSKTKTCIVIKQQAGCQRYFTKFDAARKHVLYNQDIRTIQAIGKVFDKWLADAKLFNIK